MLNAIPATEIDGVMERLVQAHTDGRDLMAVGTEIAEELGQGQPRAKREVVA